MDDETQQTYSAREIVLELFPATHERLVPDPESFRLERGTQGERLILSAQRQVLLRLMPVAPSGEAGTLICCDFCQRSAPRPYMQLFRADAPGSQGRRSLYLSLCRDLEACDGRRIGNHPIRALLMRLSP